MSSITPIKFIPPGPCRLSYAQVFEPAQGPDSDQDPVRSAALLFPKSDTKCIQTIANNLTTMANACVAAKVVSSNKGLRMPARDGDSEVSGGNRGKEYEGMIFMNAKSWKPIGIVDQNNQPIFDQEAIYSGCWVNVQIAFKYYNTKGNKGIRVELNLIQKVRDDDRFDGADSPEDVFSVISMPDSEAAVASVPGVPAAPAVPETPAPAAPAEPAEPPTSSNPFANLI